MHNNISRDELIMQLKAISKEEGYNVLNIGAMCYICCPPTITLSAPQKRIATTPRKRIFRCKNCHKLFFYVDWNQNEIKNCVMNMSHMGYDVKVESLCRNCCNELKDELYPGIDEVITIDKEHTIEISLDKRNYVFCFRTNSNEPYHRAIANDSLYYQYVLAFLQVASETRAYIVIEDNFLSKQTHILQHMTGLKIDEEIIL